MRLFRVDLLYFSIAPAGLTHSTISILLYVFLSYYQMESESKLQVPASSNEAVSYKMREGVQTMVTQAGIGLLVGGMTGIVLSRGGSSSARKVLAGFGAGIGAGSAWTKCSMSIDELLSSSK